LINNIEIFDKTIWIAWERYRRTSSLSKRLRIELYEFSSSLPRFIKYQIFILKTLFLLIQKRPKVLFVTNPSIILALFSILFKKVFSFNLVVDAHNAGVYPFSKKFDKYHWIFPFIHRHTDLTIVTNRYLEKVIFKNNGNPFVLPDPLPDLPITKKTQYKDNDFIVTFISSYASDEPLGEVIKTADLLPQNYKIFITGNSSKISDTILRKCGRNIVLTGYLSDEEYFKLLNCTDAILVLTTFSDCLVCGAYEAVSIEKPLILSDTPVLRGYFNEGVIFTQNNAKSIAESIIQSNKFYDSLCADIKKLKNELMISWSCTAGEFIKTIAKYLK